MQQNPLGTIPVVILAGGLGTRLRPVLADRPKGLAPIGEKPFLEIQIELLRRQGARRFVFSIGHLAQQIEDHFGDGRRFGVQIDYSVEGPQLLGTGGALKLAERFFAPRALVLNGDTFFDLDYAQLLARHEEEQAAATLALARADDAPRYGPVLVDPSGRRVIGFQEKDCPLSLRERAAREGIGDGRTVLGAPKLMGPIGSIGPMGPMNPIGPISPIRPISPMLDGALSSSPHPDPLPPGERESWLNAGAYVIQRELLTGLTPGEPYSLERDVFPAALGGGRKLAVLTSRQRFFDIGTPDGWRQFAEYYTALGLGATAGLSSSADGTVGQANRGATSAAGQRVVDQSGGVSCR